MILNLEAPMFKLANFRFMFVEDEALRKETYRLRYQIYVEEFGFESPSDHPEGYERDIYDAHSVHFAVVDEHSGEVVGTTRVVLNSEIGFPMTKIDHISFKGAPSDLNKIMEISRFAVHTNYRRRREDLLFYGAPEMNPLDAKEILQRVPDRRKRPVLLYGIFRLLYHLSRMKGIDFWCMISEQNLFEAVTYMGFIFHPIGLEVNFHGLRTPYIAFLDELEDYWIKEKPEFMIFLAEGLEKNIGLQRRLSTPS